jgi:acetyltransferase-like isoleucine patch superfamily enzyme
MRNLENENKYYLWDYIRAASFFSLYGCVKYLPNFVGDYFRYLVLKIFMREIHSKRIKDGATFWFPHGISIGRNVSINEYVFINGFGGVRIGNFVRIAHRASIMSENHGIDNIEKEIFLQKKIPGEIIIEDGVWIGMGAMITMGVKMPQLQNLWVTFGSGNFPSV